jgi:hypothetical protein
MATRSNQNNPEQKTKNGINSKELKARNSKRAQPVRSKQK